MKPTLVFILFFGGTCAAIPGFKADRPTFPESFTVDVEGIFKNENMITNARVFYDKINNRAAIDILFQGGLTKEIYNYDQDKVFSIQGIHCDVDKVEERNSFFPFKEDETTKKKTLATAEESFFFTKSEFFAEDLDSDVPAFVYKGTVDVTRYNRKNCNVTHRFSKADFSVAECDLRKCNMTLISISVQCGKGEDFMDHVYNFYGFQSHITDESAFQVPSGIYCTDGNALPLPEMPKFFCFNYDTTEEFSTSKGNPKKFVEISYRSLCYDSEYALVRVDNYKTDKLSSTQIYDFKNDVGVAFTIDPKQCDIGPTTDEFTPAQAAMLPDNLFDRESNKPVYVGLRQSHGLTLHVWSTFVEYVGLHAVKELYFIDISGKEANDTAGQTNDPVLQLYYVEEYYLEEEDDSLDKISYVSIRQMKTTPRDWSIFNVSGCYPDTGMKAFQVTVDAQSFLRNSTKIPFDKLDLKRADALVWEIKEKLYGLLVKSSNVSVIRLSGVEVITVSKNQLVFKGLVLEDPISLTDTIRPSYDSSMKDAFNNMQNDVGSGKIQFLIYTDELVLHLKTSSFRQFTYSSPIEDLGGYTKGSMAGIGIVMALIGALLGGIMLSVYLKSRTK